jgi:hypothetical protein
MFDLLFGGEASCEIGSQPCILPASQPLHSTAAINHCTLAMILTEQSPFHTITIFIGRK